VAYPSAYSEDHLLAILVEAILKAIVVLPIPVG